MEVMKGFTLLCLLLTPAIMLGIALDWKKHPPKKINWIYGYRTKRSTASQAAWDFAHRYCSGLWLRLGGALGAGTVLAVLLAWRQAWFYEAVCAIAAVQVAVLLLSILPVERALRARFDEHGNPKE